MAASATGSVPLSISSSVSEEDRALLTVAPSIDACSETRRSASLGLLATALWTGSEGAQSYYDRYNGSSKLIPQRFVARKKMTALSAVVH